MSASTIFSDINYSLGDSFHPHHAGSASGRSRSARSAAELPTQAVGRASADFLVLVVVAAVRGSRALAVFAG